MLCTAAKLASDPNNLPCGAQSSRGPARTRCAQTIAGPDPSGLALLSAYRRGFGEIQIGDIYKTNTGSPTPRCHCGLDPQSMNPHRRAEAAGDGSRIESGMTNREKADPVPDSESRPQTRPGWAEERSRKRIKILDVRRRRSRLVSKISVFCEHRKLPVAQRRDPDCGSPFFSLGFFGEAKKSNSPAGATPGLVVKGTNPSKGEYK